MSYGVNKSPEKYRYLIKDEGDWQFFYTWANKPDWSDGVTDVIWYKDSHMTASWWLKRDGRRYIKRPTPIVTEEEMVMLLLQVKRDE